MKKSKLRNIIRESIKKLMNEQSSPMGKTCTIKRCNGTPGNIVGICIPNSIPNAVGDGLILDYMQHAMGGNVVDIQNLNGIPFFIISSGAPCVAQYNGVDIQVSPYTSFGDFYGGNALSTQGCWNCCASNFPGTCSNACTANTACTDSNAWNYNPHATVDDGSCEYGYVCEQGIKSVAHQTFFGDKKRSIVGDGKCIPADTNTSIVQYGSVGPNSPLRFPSEQACLTSGCESKSPDKDGKTITEPAGPSITPFTTDPQSKMTDPEIDRMQDLANIKKER